MPDRSTMNDLVARVRLMIGDPAGLSQTFAHQDIQEVLDSYRDDIRYEPLEIAPTILNAASTNNQAATIFADYYSQFGFWESDVVLQGTNIPTSAAWIVLTPLAAELLIEKAHWQFELDVFTSGTAPGQYPPVFATGKVFDVFAAAADLLEFWGATQAGAYDITVNGQSLRRSQLMTAKLTLAAQYRRKAKPRRAKLNRPDILPELSTRRQRLLDSDDLVRGA